MPHHEYTEETQAKMQAMLELIEQQAKEIGVKVVVINEQAKELASLRDELIRRNNLDALKE